MNIKYYPLEGWRQQQFNDAVFRHFVEHIDAIHTLPKDLREQIKGNIAFPSVTVVDRVSSPDNTEKLLFSCADGNRFESVMLHHKDERRTLCISTQIGCPLACSFCATGQSGFERNLTAQEIVDQALFAARALSQKNENLTNIVFMGMGEPMLNLEPVMRATSILTDPSQFGFGSRRITLSTVGLIEPMTLYFKEYPQVNLAISLHSATQTKREKIMKKAADAASLDELASFISRHTAATRRRITFEYTLIDGVNDTRDDLHALISYVRAFQDDTRKLIHINLIPYNPIPSGKYRASSADTLRLWNNTLHLNRIPATIRKSLGQYHLAACGQLAQAGKPRVRERGRLKQHLLQ